MVALALGLFVTGPRVEALNLTPQYAEATSPNGSLLRRLYFLDGKEKLVAFPDAETTVMPEEGGVLFAFNDLQGATLLMRPSPHPKGAQPFDVSTVQGYRQTAQSLAPSGAERVSEARERPQAVMSGEWDSFGFLSDYALPGTRITQLVAFVNWKDGTQFVVVLSAYTDDFPKAQERVTRLLNTLRLMTDQELAEPEFS